MPEGGARKQSRSSCRVDSVEELEEVREDGRNEGGSWPGGRTKSRSKGLVSRLNARGTRERYKARATRVKRGGARLVAAMGKKNY